MRLRAPLGPLVVLERQMAQANRAIAPPIDTYGSEWNMTERGAVLETVDTMLRQALQSYSEAGQRENKAPDSRLFGNQPRGKN